MKKLILGGVFMAVIAMVYSFAMDGQNDDKEEAKAKIKWHSWEEAVELSKKNPKKMFVDVYTEWCGWCKKMDKSTFVDKEVVEYINENFYAVKFDAEQKEDVHFKGTVFKFDPQAGRRGSHKLAIALLDSRMSYPSYVYMDTLFQRITISPGFKEPKALLKEMKFVADNVYLKKTWEDYLKGN
ncbi:MAG: DUF255 domain-containing protein [Fluviicola sp.]|nr:DUF255 domain-containing protein [Fluviicola sp.]